MIKSWKTTVTGVCSIVAAITGAISSIANDHPVDWATVIAAIMAGVGLITAKDSAVIGDGKTPPTP